MQRTLDAGGVRVMSYIGDAYEENADEAFAQADLADNAKDRAQAIYASS